MKSEEELKKDLDKLEKYMLGELGKGKLPTQLIWAVNTDEKIEVILRGVLKWVLTNKYQDRK